LDFHKVQGAGNDFVLFDLREHQKEFDYGNFAVSVCNRNFGIGADGILLVLPSKKADARMRIFNSDGSEAEMCGNGIRCFARYIFEKEAIKKQEIEIETLAGIIKPKINLDSQGKFISVTVNMGIPILSPDKIPVKLEGDRIVNYPLVIGGSELRITTVSMGNPHCVIFSKEISEMEISDLGRKIENHKIFPYKTNVEFVEILNKEEAFCRVWERGAGETLACGTGAVLVAGVLQGLLNNVAKIFLPGGKLVISWQGENQPVYMEGPAEIAFSGTIEDIY